MKKVLALLVVAAFVFTVVAPASFAATASAKKVVAKKVVKKVVKKAVKKAPVAPRVVAPPPPPAPVAVPPPPAPVKVAAPAPAAKGLMGLGLQTAAEVGLQAGMVALSGNVLLADPMGLGAMVGLPANSVMYKLGVGYASGNDTNSKSWKAVPITLGAVAMLPADMMGGIETFVGGGINYVVYRTGQTGGSIGGDIYVGAQGDLGLGGKTYGEVGYSILRTGDGGTKGSYSSKSVTVMVGQKILL